MLMYKPTTRRYLTQLPPPIKRVVWVDIAPWRFLLRSWVTTIIFWGLQFPIHGWLTFMDLRGVCGPFLARFSGLGDINCAVIPAPSMCIAVGWNYNTQIVNCTEIYWVTRKKVSRRNFFQCNYTFSIGIYKMQLHYQKAQGKHFSSCAQLVWIFE